MKNAYNWGRHRWHHRTSVEELIQKKILFTHRKYYDLKNKIIIKRKENTKQVKYMTLKTKKYLLCLDIVDRRIYLR